MADPELSLEDQKKLVLPFMQVPARRSGRLCSSASRIRSQPAAAAACDSVPPRCWPSLTCAWRARSGGDSSCDAAQRAQEVEKVDPKVAYYCRLYAIEQVR